MEPVFKNINELDIVVERRFSTKAPTGTEIIYIYALCDKMGYIRYIGATTDPEKRLKLHFKQQHNIRMDEWFKEMFRKRQEPVMEILTVVPRGKSDNEERYWIAKIRRDAVLYNIEPGGKSFGKGRRCGDCKRILSRHYKG